MARDNHPDKFQWSRRGGRLERLQWNGKRRCWEVREYMTRYHKARRMKPETVFLLCPTSKSVAIRTTTLGGKKMAEGHRWKCPVPLELLHVTDYPAEKLEEEFGECLSHGKWYDCEHPIARDSPIAAWLLKRNDELAAAKVLACCAYLPTTHGPRLFRSELAKAVFLLRRGLSENDTCAVIFREKYPNGVSNAGIGHEVYATVSSAFREHAKPVVPRSVDALLSAEMIIDLHSQGLSAEEIARKGRAGSDDWVSQVIFESCIG